jgi:hypothetical protein
MPAASSVSRAAFLRTSQSTARIDRTVRKVLISRDFVQAVLSWVSTASGPLPTANRLHENLLFCRSFSSSLVMAVGAVGILASFTMI